MEEDQSLKIVIIGESNTGKTCFLTQYIDSVYRDFNVSTHGIGIAVSFSLILDYRIKKIKHQK